MWCLLWMVIDVINVLVLIQIHYLAAIAKVQWKRTLEPLPIFSEREREREVALYLYRMAELPKGGERSTVATGGFNWHLDNLCWVELAAAVTGWDSRHLLSTCPFFSRLQSNWFLHCCSPHAQHVLVFFISQVWYCLCLLVPWVPHHCNFNIKWNYSLFLSIYFFVEWNHDKYCQFHDCCLKIFLQ